MKTILLTLALATGLATASQAQDTVKTVKKTRHVVTKTRKTVVKEGWMSDGVMMKNNQMMRSHNRKWTVLSETYFCENGSKVSIDGSVIRTDGSVTKLKNGQGLYVSGKMLDQSKP